MAFPLLAPLLIGGGQLLASGISGLIGKKGADDARQAQQQSLDAAMKRLQGFSQDQYRNRMSDLDQTMSFYNPAENYLRSIYGGPPRSEPLGGKVTGWKYGPSGGMPGLPPPTGMSPPGQWKSTG